MHKAMWRTLGVAALLAAGLALSGCEGGGDDGMTMEDWTSMVSMGMTRAEVYASIGRDPDGPINNSRLGPGVYWRFGNAQGSCYFDGRDVLVAHAFSPDMYGVEEVFEDEIVE